MDSCQWLKEGQGHTFDVQHTSVDFKGNVFRVWGNPVQQAAAATRYTSQAVTSKLCSNNQMLAALLDAETPGMSLLAARMFQFGREADSPSASSFWHDCSGSSSPDWTTALRQRSDAHQQDAGASPSSTLLRPKLRRAPPKPDLPRLNTPPPQSPIPVSLLPPQQSPLSLPSISCQDATEHDEEDFESLLAYFTM